MKLSKRLQNLDKMISTPYEHIWDCCCDHGLLGMSLLSRQAAENIHFVDIVPYLMQTIEQKLQQFFSNSPSTWTTHCLDVQKLPLKEYQSTDTDKHLVIIAGVGGDLTAAIVEAIYLNNPTMNIDFLLCPVHHQFTLRKKLIELEFSVKNEMLIEENKRFYEMLLVSSNLNEGRKISTVGDQIWQSNSVEQSLIVQNYLKKTLNHYQRLQLNKISNAKAIVTAYKNKKSNNN